MKELRFIDEHGYPIFLLKIKSLEDHRIEFEVFAIDRWNAETKEPTNGFDALEFYCRGSIKFDGCSHVWIGRPDDGYLHLCGVTCWKNHCRVMEWIYRELTKLIPHMDKPRFGMKNPCESVSIRG